MKHYSLEIELDKTEMKALASQFSNKPTPTDRTIVGTLLFLSLLRLKQQLEAGLKKLKQQVKLELSYEQLTALYYWAGYVDSTGIDLETNSLSLYARAVADKIIEKIPVELLKQLQ